MSKKSKKIRVLVTGASGFIGHHLARYLVSKGYWVRGVDIRPKEFDVEMDEFLKLDLQNSENCNKATKGVDWVFHLASNMGGMGFISENYAEIFHGNSLMDLNMIEATRKSGVKKYFYASTACVYPEELQTKAKIKPLREEDLYPANPQGSYGMEKFMGERLCEYYRDDYGLDVKIVRFHNVYGPECVFDGGREKAPAALSRKVAEACGDGGGGVVEIWGDGEQTRSFLYIDDALSGILKFMKSSYIKPLNVGSDRMVSINEMVDIISERAEVKVSKMHVKGPQGVRGRCSSNERVWKVLKWKPKISLEEGLGKTYQWIEKEIKK